MKQYPRIYHHNKGIIGDHIFAFDKLDGSNLRFEWGTKRGWYKFGSRKRMIDRDTPILGEGIDIFMEKYADQLDTIFRTNKEYRNFKSFVVFAEFIGPNSFAGLHEETDKKDLVLIDVNRHQKSFTDPRDFINDFGHLGIPDIVYRGEYNEEFINNVRNDYYNLSEGVVCKGVKNKKVWMVKIKTYDWLQKVKKKMGIEFIKEDFNNDKNLINEFTEKDI